VAAKQIRRSEMVRFEPGPNRWKLGFKDAVLESFKFLRKYGYRRVRADVTFVRYETPWYSFKRRFYVNVYHARGSYEMGVEVGPKDSDPEMVNLPWILRWAGAPEAGACFGNDRGRTMLFAETREAVQTLVPRMAELVRKYAAPFLRRDPEAFKAVNAMTKQASEIWVEQTNRLAPKRHEATLAWEAQDFERVAAIYGTFEDELMAEEKEQLAEARKQLAGRAATRFESRR
jgi:hypothetical protein